MSHIAFNLTLNFFNICFSSFSSLVKQNTSQNVCELCNSSNISGCSCKNKQKSNVSASYVETSGMETSVETTALEDLPGL